MSVSTSAYRPLTRFSGQLSNRAGLLAFVVLSFLIAAFLVKQNGLQLLLLLPAAVLTIALAIAVIVDRAMRRNRARVVQIFAVLAEDNPLEQLVSDGSGKLLFCNGAAREAAKPNDVTVSQYLSHRTVDADEVVSRILYSCLENGASEEELPLRDKIIQIKAQPISPGAVQWSFATVQPQADVATSASVPRLPMLTVGRSDTILFMNTAARSLLGERKKTLTDVFGPDFRSPREANTVSTATGEQQCLVAEYDVSAGRREIYLLPTDVPVVRDGAVQFDELPVALLKISKDGRVVLANRAARVMVNREITNTTVMSDLMEGLGRSIQDWLTEVAVGVGGNHSEFLRVKRADKEVFVQVSLNRVVEGDSSSLIAVLSDATELKSLEAQFVQSQKMQAIGQLAGGVAHDFNNLLTAISGHCDLLLLRHDQGDTDFADLIQINQNANRAAALVGQLLAFSRKQNLRPEVLDLRNILSDLTHLLNRLVGERVTLSLSNDPVLPAIRADKRQLEQVLMNLVVNARDAMPDGGEIRVTTEGVELEVPLERDRVVVPAGQYVSVTVADDGSGIAPDYLQKVFEPFFTTKRTGEGTGLGLSTAYGIVKQSGGYIFVDSIEGTGTVFKLLFPAHAMTDAVQALPVKSEKVSAPIVETSGVVLLVEDEAPVRSFAARALKMRGFTVLEACCGEDAAELLERDAPHVDVFVSDVIMPGMDGPSWVRQARQSYPDVPVIFVSGYAEDSFSDDQARIENSSFLPKPFSLSDLTEAVHARVTASQGKLS